MLSQALANVFFRVPPSPEEDSETFTPVHPDVMSAPEMETLIRNFKSRLVEVSEENFLNIDRFPVIIILARTRQISYEKIRSLSQDLIAAIFIDPQSFQIVRGFMLLRQEKPGRFCLVLSSLFLMMAILGTKVTLAVLIHTVLLAFLVIPALVAR